MSTRPVIFISAVSRELHTARDLVAKTLLALGYEPKWQDIAPTDTGDLRAVLRKWIDESDAVLQLVGHCYGHAPTSPDPLLGPCSYTQYEALYARKQGKKVYYILTDPAHPTDGCACKPDPKPLHALQENYRKIVKAYGDLYHSSSSLKETELLVRCMEDKLAHLRRRSKQHAALVLGLLVVLVFGGIWMTRKQNDSNQNISLLLQQNKDFKEGQADLRQMIEFSIKGGSEQKLTASYDTALRFIAYKRGISLNSFRVFLDQNATHALGDPGTSLKDKVRALQEAGQFVKSRDFALEQARRLETERQKSSKEEVELWTEAAKTELTLGHYDKALEYATKATTQTNRHADFPSWSNARNQQGRALIKQWEVKEAQSLYEELIPLQLDAFGPDHLAVLKSRINLAVIIYDQGNYTLAVKQGRALVDDCQRVLGAEHYDTLVSRNNLAEALRSQGNYTEAEQENRQRIMIEERVLGAEHPDTLMSRNNLANTLNAQGKHAEAEQEYRIVVKLQERVLGEEHPDTLASRMNLANTLQAQGKHAEVNTEQDQEQEYRVVIQVQERVLGAEHPDVALSCYNLARCLKAQQKLTEALEFMQRAEQVRMKILGPDHPDTRRAKTARESIEAELK